MDIVGSIREQDRAACSGMVAEGDQFTISDGRAYAFRGARMACKKNCVIAEGYAFSTLTNGCSQVIHGMRTSGGCPLYSTLNGVDGVASESGEAIAEQHVDDPRYTIGIQKTGTVAPCRTHRFPSPCLPAQAACCGAGSPFRSGSGCSAACWPVLAGLFSRCGAPQDSSCSHLNAAAMSL
jgi:uncharacterized Zn-binding protein involved in type VI secretion